MEVSLGMVSSAILKSRKQKLLIVENNRKIPSLDAAIKTFEKHAKNLKRAG